MIRHLTSALGCLVLTALPAFAEAEPEGTLNPDEMSLNRVLRDA